MKLDIIPGIKSFYENARHIINVSYKPGVEHFTKTLKIVLIGTLIVGVLGFIISSIINFILLGHI